MNDDIRQVSHIEHVPFLDQKRLKDTCLNMDKEANGKLSRTGAVQPTLNKLNSVVENKIVWVRVEFENIGEVDTMNEKFQALVRIICKWYHVDDDEDIADYDPKKHWYPKLYIENALHDVKEDITYKVSKLENGKTLITETRFAKGSFWERIELQNFPIDIQELSITIASRFKSNHVKLMADTVRLSKIHSECLHTFRDQQKFQLYKIVNTSETASYDAKSTSLLSLKSENVNDNLKKFNFNESKRSKFVATCFCSRRPGYYLMNCYAFNFLITLLSMTIFAIDTEKAPNRISGTFTLILTSVSFKWVTNRSIPTISYMTSLDRYQIIQIVYLAMCCVWHSTISTLNFNDPSRKVVYDKIALGSFAFAFCLIQIVFSVGIVVAYQKIKELKKREEKYVRRQNLSDTCDDESDED